MNKPRIYVDTSVIGGCEDAEFREHSQKLMELFAQGAAIMILSDLTLDELKQAPSSVRAWIGKVPPEGVENVILGDEAKELAEAYIANGAISPKMRPDALHIAAATIARAGVLISWNFKHIVNLPRIRAYNSVNLKLGYPQLEIRTPQEVIPNE